MGSRDDQRHEEDSTGAPADRDAYPRHRDHDSALAPEHRRAVRAAAARQWPARSADPDAPFKWVDWNNFGMGLPDDDPEAFIAVIEEAKGPPLIR